MTPVTDPALLKQLESGEAIPAGLKPVTDQAILAQLEEQPASRSLPAQAARAVGRTVRAGVQGVTALPNMLGDALGLRSSESVRNLLTKFGLPVAENATERVAEDVAGGMAGAGGMVGLGRGMAGAGNALVQRIGEVLATAPGLQVASGATGPGAASVTREAGGGPGAQMAAGVAGAFAPSAGTALAEGARLAFRGGEAGRQRLAQNVETFEKAGAGTPTVGQGTEGRANRAVESLLAKLPGSSGRMAAKAQAEVAGLGSKVDDMAASLAARSGAAPAGRQIASGIDDFVTSFKASSSKLYDKVDQYIAPDTKVPAANTLAKLKELTKPIPGATKTSALIQTPKLAAVEAALAKDAGATPAQPILSRLLGPDGKQIVTGETLAQPGGLPYQAMKELRSAIGAKLANPSLVDDVPTGQWKQLYGALTRDMGAAARAAGPKAEAAMVRASNHYRSGLKRIEEVLQPVLAKGDPEDIFKAAIAGTKEGATTLKGVMKGLPMESRKVVTATVLRRLGEALPGKQGAAGDTFSAETFLTNWNRLHPAATSTLFAPMPDGMRADLNRIAQVAANMREGSKVFANPSGTAQGVASQVPLFVLIGTGSVGAAVGQPVAANLAARLMVNPTVVRWLAKTTRTPMEQLPVQLNQLFQQSMYMTGEERKDVREYVSAVRREARAARAQELPATSTQAAAQ